LVGDIFLRFSPTLALAAALASACATPHSTTPPPDVPAAFASANAQPGKWPAEDWYHAFGSTELDSLIDAAVRANFDLQIARERVVQADARARQAGAAILPTLDANGTAGFMAGHSGRGGGHESDWAAMLSASYEFDFWGARHAQAEAATALAAGSRAERDAVALTTLAGVANAYFELLAIRERLAVARQDVDSASQLLDVVQARAQVASATPGEVAAQKTVVVSAQIAATDLQRAESAALTALSLLLGRAPEGFAVDGQSLESLREPVVAAGLPSELITRRPDVFLAEANLRAGNADVAAARAAMLPSLTLTASGGVQNPALPGAVLTIPGAGPSLALGASLIQPIFNHGKLLAQRDEVQARNRELLVAYRAAIVAALNDVENALTARRHLDAARELETENVALGEQMLAGAQARYQAGTADMESVLGAQRSLFAARDQLIQYRLARLQAVVSLCKALGGGWSVQHGYTDMEP
jgi:multidrug efflux system outer membrane protein